MFFASSIATNFQMIQQGNFVGFNAHLHGFCFIDFNQFPDDSAGGQPRVHSWLPNEEGYATTDMESDQLHVPALFFHFNRRMASG